MKCPFCGADDTKVVDSRLAQEDEAVRRRRECVGCSERFTTYEVAELTFPRIIKQDGSHEPFDEAKLQAGLMRALEKRPVSTDAIEAALLHIKRRLRESVDREVTSQDIGLWVMDELRTLDKVAYVRFASVYRSFQDVQAFREEIERLEKSTSS